MNKKVRDVDILQLNTKEMQLFEATKRMRDFNERETKASSSQLMRGLVGEEHISRHFSSFERAKERKRDFVHEDKQGNVTTFEVKTIEISDADSSNVHSNFHVTAYREIKADYVIFIGVSSNLSKAWLFGYLDKDSFDKMTEMQTLEKSESRKLRVKFLDKISLLCEEISSREYEKKI